MSASGAISYTWRLARALCNPQILLTSHIFKEDSSGNLSFIGDFEGFYKNEQDPWGQSGGDKRMKSNYAFSRRNLLKEIDFLIKQKDRGKDILEIGCGLGHVSAYLSAKLHYDCSITGMDISPTAIAKAKANFPHLSFSVGDICSDTFVVNEKFDIVILSEILWYILGQLGQAFDNVEKLLKTKGVLIISNTFIDEQKYGKEIVDGFDGLVRYVVINHWSKFKIIKAQVDYFSKRLHHSSLLLLQKK